ncbi:MAG: CopD family protein [Acidimicrobiales bacterium]
MTAPFWQVLFAYLHLLGVAVYVGGSVAMEFVIGPAQSYVPPAQAQVIGQRSADRFLVLVWAALLLLPVSGTLLFFSLSDQNSLSGEKFFTTSYGQTLLAMIVLWAVLVVNGVIITFRLRPRLAQRASAPAGGAGVAERLEIMRKAARQVSVITRIDLVIAVFIVLLGASLSYGGGLL